MNKDIPENPLLAAPGAPLVIDCETIETYEDTGRVFLQRVLEMDWDAVLLTDLSELSDYFPKGAPDGVVDCDVSLPEMYQAWDQWVISRIEDVYGIHLDRTKILLTALFAQIEDAAKAAVRH